MSPPIMIFPLLVTVNFVLPADDAVNRSPVPELLTTIAAKLVAPETDAIAVVAELPLTSSVARGVDVPIPAVPFEERYKLFVLLPGWNIILPVVLPPRVNV